MLPAPHPGRLGPGRDKTRRTFDNLGKDSLLAIKAALPLLVYGYYLNARDDIPALWRSTFEEFSQSFSTIGGN